MDWYGTQWLTNDYLQYWPASAVKSVTCLRCGERSDLTCQKCDVAHCPCELELHERAA